MISSTVHKPTQLVRIVAMLKEAGPRGICSWNLAYRSFMPHASSRITELNRRGYEIEGETKDWPNEGHGCHSHYYLVGEPAPSALSSNAGRQIPVVDDSAVRAGGNVAVSPAAVSAIRVGGVTKPDGYTPARTAQQLSLAEAS